MYLGMQAQYYQLSYPNIGRNPGGLNTDAEVPLSGGLDPGWQVIHPGGAATPAWSQVQDMPFLFMLNGQPAFQYKVSTSGVLTFSVNAAAVPGGINQELPSAAIPDQSICIWGLKGSTGNDKIVRKIFGTAPNRQLWIMFNAYEYEGGSPICNLFWSIVLEESTHNIYLVDQRGSLISTCQAGLTLGVQVDASTAYQVAGSPSLNNLSGTNSTSADNSYYAFIPGVQPDNDMEAVSLQIPASIQYSDAPVSVTGTFLNLGAAPLKSFDLHYSVNGVQAPVQHYSYYNGPLTLTHFQPWVPAAPGVYAIRMWVDGINGEADANPANNAVERQVYVAEEYPDRLALIESFTQHNCGPCAAQNPALEATLGQHPHTAQAVKWVVTWPAPNDDPRYFFNPTDNSTRRVYYNVTGVPTTVLAGTWQGSPAGVNGSLINTETAKPGLYKLDIAESAASGSISVTVKASPVRPVAATSPVLQVAIIQDELHYNAPPGSNGETDFYHIMRYTLPNANGTAVSTLPGVETTVSGTRPIDPIFSHSFVRVVAWVQDNATQEVLMASRSGGIYICGNGSLITPSVTVNDAACTGNTGSASISLSGSSGNATYVWNTGETAASIASKAPGNYKVTVTDGTCSFEVPVRIGRKAAPNLALAASNPTCHASDNGRIEALVVGGEGDLTYAWSNTGSTSMIENLAPGAYTLTVTDAAGCTATASATLAAPAELTALAQAEPDFGSGGAASVAAAGGSFPYTYLWNSTPAQTTALATGLPAGDYEVRVRDYYGCEVVRQVTVSNKTTVDELAAGIRMFRAFPNPTDDLLTLDLQLSRMSAVQYALLDAQGRAVVEGRVPQTMQVSETLSLGKLPAGLYVLQVRTDAGTAYRSISVK